MSKNIKDKSQKMNKKKALSCLVAAAVMLSAGVVVFNKTEIASAVASNGQGVNQKSEVVIDSTEKIVTNLDELANLTELNFKLPSYMGNGTSYHHTSVESITDNQVVTIYYSNKENLQNEFQLHIFKENPEEVLKSISESNYGHDGNVQVQENLSKLGNIEGKEIVVKNLMTEGDEVKSFAWKDNDNWYAITYYANSFDTVLKDFSKDEVKKIAESLTEISIIDKEKYTADKIDEIRIYTNSDLKKAKELLGFEPKVIKNSNDLVLESSTASKFDDRTSIVNHYEKGKIVYSQHKMSDASYNLEDSIKIQNDDYSKCYSDIKEEKLEEGSMKAYKTIITDASVNYTIINYHWEQDGLTNVVSISHSSEDGNLDMNTYDNIVKKLMSEK